MRICASLGATEEKGDNCGVGLRLWAAHLPTELGGGGFGQVTLGLMHEILGQCRFASGGVFGNNAPDSGNAELIARGGNQEQKERWMHPLLRGELRSAFSMTEPGAGSDPTMLCARAVLDDSGPHAEYVINGPSGSRRTPRSPTS